MGNKVDDGYGRILDELNLLEQGGCNAMHGSVGLAKSLICRRPGGEPFDLPDREVTEEQKRQWLMAYLADGGGLLPDWMIRERVGITPFVEACPKGVVSYGLGHYGYDIRIDTRFKVFTPVHNVVVDPKNLDPRSFVDIDATEQGYCIIPPNSFALGVSVETFDIPREVLGVALGKSTYARCGIVVPITPLEPEWKGKLTIEISNTTPLPAKIYAGEGIAQVLFFKAVRLCRRSYADKGGKYQHQTDLTLPFV